MTVLNVDGALVIFEGIHRLQWRQDWHEQWPADGRCGSPERTLSSIWPDKDTGARIRRQIDQHLRVVVVLEDTTPVITLARRRVPSTPSGAIELAGSDSTTCLLSIPPFTWLAERHRRRGEEFVDNAAQHTSPSLGRAVPDLLVEDSLIGTREPVRFIFGTAPLTFGVLRAAIDRLYRSSTPGTRDVTDLGGLSPARTKVPVERRKAA